MDFKWLDDLSRLKPQHYSTYHDEIVPSRALLIGSRALLHHCPEFRKPRDFDLIATAPWIKAFHSRVKQATPTVEVAIIDNCVQKKVVFRLEKSKYEIAVAFVDGSGYWAEKNSSLKLLEHCFQHHLDNMSYDSLLSLPVKVAPLRILYLLKKSHIHWDHQFDKHMSDLHFLRSRLIERKDAIHFDQEEQKLLVLRIKEKKEQDGDPAGHIHLNQNSDDFLEYKNKLFAKRYIRHDDIHDLVAFTLGQPLYKRILVSPEKATCSEKKWNLLTEEERLNDVREEAMVLGLERYILPSYSAGLPICVRKLAAKNMYQLNQRVVS